jgi:chromosome partitioning protein
MDNERLYTLNKIEKIFLPNNFSRSTIIFEEARGKVPTAKRTPGGHRKWPTSDLVFFGKKFGFLENVLEPLVISVFSTKGGVFKTSIAYNLARILSLHGMKVLISGLDSQCDISGISGHSLDMTGKKMTLKEALKLIGSVNSIVDLLDGGSLNDMILDTDIPTLKFIPETPDLEFLEEKISGMKLREFWLRNNVIRPAKIKFDIIILDMGAVWNMLTTNALMASDAVISPIECKINQFRNVGLLQHKFDKFKKETETNFETIFIPVKHKKEVVLNNDIYKHYVSNINNCLHSSLRETQQGEDAIANRLSVFEYDPTSSASHDMRKLKNL